MPRQTEPSANAALGILIQQMLPASQIRYENTQVVAGHAGHHPDLLITTPGRSPVIIEAEFMPAITVQDDAKQRLGLQVVNDSRPVEAVIALRYPEAIRETVDLHATLRGAQLSYCIPHARRREATFTSHAGFRLVSVFGIIATNVEIDATHI